MIRRMPSRSVPRSDERSRGTLVAAVIATWAALHLLALQRHAPPPALGVETPPSAFSAGRARAFLDALAPEQEPRPMGSAAAARVRARLVAELECLGLEASVEQRFVCGPWGSCGTPANVIGRFRDAPDEPVVLLVAHYDSVVAGPGIGDDLSSVAALLEIVRALASDGPLRRPVELLFTDGEEQGLLGAAAYASARDPGSIAAVLNLEARGTSGPSMLFETGPESGPLVEAYARSVRRPAAMSISEEVYSRMPNDTDFSVFRDLGIAGLNFAFIGGWHAYHTPLDRVERLDWDSIQHQGESALAVARALARDGLPEGTPGELVYADVLGHGLLRWPASWGVPMALLTTLALVVRIRLGLRKGTLERAALLRGARSGGLALITAVVAGMTLQALLRTLAGQPVPGSSSAVPAMVAWWCTGGLALLLASRRSGGGTEQRAAEAWGGWLAWSLVGLGASVWAPGGGYLFLLPLLPAVVAATLVPGATSARAVAVVAVGAWLVAALFWSPLQVGFEVALRRAPSWATTVPVTCVGTLLLPLFAVLRARARRLLALVLLVVLLLASGLTLRGPHQSPERPAPLNYAYVDQRRSLPDASASIHDTSWEASALFGLDLPVAVRSAVGFDREVQEPAAWNLIPTYRALAAPSERPGPDLEVLEELEVDVGRRTRVRIRPGAGAARTMVAFDAVVEVSVGGSPVVQQGHPGQTVVFFIAPGPEGVEVELARDSSYPLIGLLIDQHDGLPGPEAGAAIAAERARLEDARPPDRVPIGPGDQTVVVRPFRF